MVLVSLVVTGPPTVPHTGPLTEEDAAHPLVTEPPLPPLLLLQLQEQFQQPQPRLDMVSPGLPPAGLR